jgi:hypothetical protein
MTYDLQRRADELAFLMVGMLPADQHRILVDAFARALVDRPDLREEDEVSPLVAVFIGAIVERVHELEQGEIGTA